MDIKIRKFENIKEFEIAVSAKSIYPFVSMDVGDFFEIPDQKKPQIVATACCIYGKNTKRNSRLKLIRVKKSALELSNSKPFGAYLVIT